jgi:hypothetical protein
MKTCNLRYKEFERERGTKIGLQTRIFKGEGTQKI